MIQEPPQECINAYESLADERFKGSKGDLLYRIGERLKDKSLKTWNKVRLKALKEKISKLK